MKVAEPKPQKRVEPLRERKADFAVSWPNVIRIEHVYTPTLKLDVAHAPKLRLNAAETAIRAESAPVLEGKPDVARLTEIELEEHRRLFRLQRIVFETARDVYDQRKPSWSGNKAFLLAQLIRFVEEMFRSDRIEIAPALFNQDNF